MIREVVPEDNQITVVNIHGFINSCVSACAWNLATITYTQKEDHAPELLFHSNSQVKMQENL